MTEDKRVYPQDDSTKALLQTMVSMFHCHLATYGADTISPLDIVDDQYLRALEYTLAACVQNADRTAQVGSNYTIQDAVIDPDNFSEDSYNKLLAFIESC